MNEEELPIDSDSSDEDYKPTGAENELSEEESGNESDEPCSDAEKNDNKETKKRKKSTKGRTRKKVRNGRMRQEEEKEKEEEKENSEIAPPEEDLKKKSDLLWADFLRDCGPPAKKSSSLKTDTVSVSKPSTETITPSKPETNPKPEPQKITQILSFAGEEVKVEKTVTPESSNTKKGRGSGGISSILSQIGKKGKLSTLEKSKLDWERFKSDEGIKEDIETHNKGKNGYLEKQDFLQRTDLRQFEIEKNMRSSRRSLKR